MTPNIFGPDQVPPSQTKENPSNKSKSTRYNLLTFFPVTTILQFTRVVNVFYLFNGILQSIPSVSTNDAIVTFIPLSMIVLMGVLKEGFLEVEKWLSDKQVNATPYRKLVRSTDKAASPVNSNESGRADGVRFDFMEARNFEYAFETVAFKDIKVGDILEIRDGETFPADCILLKTAQANGQVFVQTAALDGERTLKPLLAPYELQENFMTYFGPQLLMNSDPRVLPLSNVEFKMVQPMKELYAWEGTALVRSEENGAPVSIELGIQQFLHKGATLCNSQTVLCLVAYTGAHTKLHMNMSKYRFKQSQLEFDTNMSLFYNLLLMLCMAGSLATANYVFSRMYREGHAYLYEGAPSDGQISTAAFFSFYLILNQFIPMELPVIMEFGKYVATYFMCSDAVMCRASPVTGAMEGLQVKNMNVHEDMADVSYILCDKTGTLTQNELVFDSMSLVLGCSLRKRLLCKVNGEKEGDPMEQLRRSLAACADDESVT